MGQALSHPLGQGIGKVTIAGAKFGGESANTEADPSNVAVSMGVAGVIAYAVVVVVGLRRGLPAAPRPARRAWPSPPWACSS